MNPTPEIRGSKIILFLLCYALTTPRFAQAQCTASGPNSPGTATSTSFAGSDYSFNNPSNISVDDNSRSTASSIISLLSGQTEYLQATNFGFSIPVGSTICGIEVNVVKSATNVVLNLTSVTDYNVRIIKNGTVSGTNLADGSTLWPSSDTYTSYGNDNELWGTTWSQADINSSDFGISFSAEINGLVGLLPSARIDYISMTVYYLDPSVLSGSGEARNSTVRTSKATDNTLIKCYPNPFTTAIQVAGVLPGERVAITNIFGQRLYLSPPAINNTMRIDVNDLQPGMYVISTGNKKMKILKK
ncbi:T9SS type A sorting domain-containing protein [Niastella caeni]|uniref:T9SS type A sorting domain-containing protein n=1 Tax=Niastella caeni TaxID=2569763 RepID=A0A4S8HZL8_9BACT|nr:T9SS type A sorting domain-containing protein [Niastella caeni]THU41298.1 T9SS type A sorting domain-containing protein [Niastella caeni]